MIFDWLIYGLIIWAIASLLNYTMFNSKPASKLTAWFLTIIIFFISIAALLAAKIIRFQLMSDELGVSINPSSPLDMGGAFVFSWLFYGFLNKKEKHNSESDKSFISTPNRTQEHENNKEASIEQVIEDQFYEIAWSEVENDSTKKTLWSKSFSECEGDSNKTKAQYINLRVNELKAEKGKRIKQEELQKQLALENRADEELMADYGITFDGEYYHFGIYKYAKLINAVNYAKLQNSKSNA